MPKNHEKSTFSSHKPCPGFWEKNRRKKWPQYRARTLRTQFLRTSRVEQKFFSSIGPLWNTLAQRVYLIFYSWYTPKIGWTTQISRPRGQNGVKKWPNGRKKSKTGFYPYFWVYLHQKLSQKPLFPHKRKLKFWGGFPLILRKLFPKFQLPPV